jgi:hypothetical protein
VLGNGHQRGVEHGAAGRIGLLAGEQQEEVVREGELADQVAAQVLPAHDDGVFVRGADGGARDGGFADFHGAYAVFEVAQAASGWRWKS